MRSLQRMLALRYGATMFVALMGIAAWAYLGVRAGLERQVDRSIASSAGLMVDVVATGEPLAEHMGSVDLPGFVAEVNRVVVTRDSSGGILDQNSPLAGNLPFDSAAFLQARSGEPAYSTGDLSGIRIRSYYRPSPAHPRGTTRSAVIQVAASLAPLGRDSLDVLLRLLATGLLGTIVTALGAGWLARSSLAPVAEIAAQARTVTSRGPRPQITVHADVIELQDLIQVLNEMLGRMERALSQQRRIISDVGHELRTPITVMRGEVEVALRGTRQPEQYQAMLRSVLEEVDRLALMGEELIVLARCEAGELTPQAVACDLKDLVAQAVAEARRKHPHEPIEVDLAQVRVNADPRLLGMAIDQLIDNALRHTPSGTPIRLTTWEEGAHACLAVEDAGPGVPEESLSQLTEPFFRTDRARGRGGAGLGLTVVAAIAALHRGDITPSRGSLGGLRVEVALPTGIEGSILRG